MKGLVWVLALAALGSGCQPATMSSDERDARFRKLFNMPHDHTWAGAMWRFDDTERGVTCYLSSGHDILSCVRMDETDRELAPTPPPRPAARRPRPLPIQ